MRFIDEIIIHCSATKLSQTVDTNVIRKWHTKPKSEGGRGWSDIGYHLVIERDGEIQLGRPLERIGAHCKGHNKTSVGICLVGGLNEAGEPDNNFSDVQFDYLEKLIISLRVSYPDIKSVKGHRDYSPDRNNDGKITPDEWFKVCPCFDVGEWMESVGL